MKSKNLAPASRLFFCQSLMFSMLCALLALSARAERKPIDFSPSPPERVNKNFDEFIEISKQVEPELDKFITVRLTALPELTLAGEKVKIRLRALASKIPNASLEIYPRFLEGKMKEKEVIQLRWKKTGTKGERTVYEAGLDYQPKAKGNYLLHWVSGIDGDIQDFWRYFAAIDASYAVCSLESTGTHTPGHGPDRVLHELHIPFKYWMDFNLFRQGWNAERWAAFSRDSRRYGDEPALLIFCSMTAYDRDPRWNFKDDSWQVTLQKESPAIQRLVLERYQKDVLPRLGFDSPIENVHTYGIGTSSARLAREAGYKTLGSLCAGLNYVDTNFPINHDGMPFRPYFVSREDFRKPGDSGPNGLVGISQCMDHPTLLCDYSAVYTLEVSHVFHAANWCGPGRAIHDEIAISQPMDFLEAMLQNRLSQTVPYIINSGLEFGGVFPGVEQAFDYFIRTLARKTTELPLAFATGDAISDFYRRHYTKTPETTCYLPDVYCGLRSSGGAPGYRDKPPCSPDVMEIEGETVNATFKDPEILAYKQYDYGARWNFPDWGNDGIPRNNGGRINPDTDDRFRMTPAIIDTRLFSVQREERETAKATVITFKVQAKVAQKKLALAVWNIPREWRTGRDWFSSSRGCRFVPVRAPFSGDLNGVLIGDVKPGANTFTLKVKSAARKLRGTAVALNGGGIQGRVYERDGRPMAYLCAMGKTTETLTLDVPAGRDVRFYVAPEGAEVRCQPGKNEVKLGESGWMRLTGLSRDEVAAQGAKTR